MTESQIKNLTEIIGTERILFDELLKDHTYFKQKGRVKMCFEAKTASDLELAVSASLANNIPFCVIGLGSNTFFPKSTDFLLIKNTTHAITVKGYRTSLTSEKSFSEILLRVDSGTPLTMLARYCIHEEIKGLEFLLGIPGTVGAGIRNNVGAMPTVKNIIGNYLSLAEIIERKSGQKKLVDSSFFNFEYGKSELQKTNDILISAIFKLSKAPNSDPWSTSDLNTTTDLITGPVFGNIAHRDAVRLYTKHFTLAPGYLIQQLDFDNLKIGEVKVSDRNHNSFSLGSNFEVDDVARLIRLIKREIKQKFNLNLETQLDIIKNLLNK